MAETTHAPLTWDADEDRLFETGVDHCAIYLRGDSGYETGVAWNGIISITESPEGAEPNDLYADNMKYVSLYSAEDIKGSIECYTYPDAFKKCNGEEELTAGMGVTIAQQARATFGLAYRTKVGNAVKGDNLGYKLHILYGCSASPSERAYESTNDSPDGITFSYDFTTTPTPVTGFKPTALLIVDSTKCPEEKFNRIQDELFGKADSSSSQTDGYAPTLLLPDAVKAILDTTA